MKVTVYLESKKRAWSPTTLKNAAPMLAKYEEDILADSPESLFRKVEQQGMRVSSIGTLFTLAAGFCKFVNGTETFNQWRRENANAFKVKEVKKVGKSKEDIIQAVQGAEDCWQKEVAKEILLSAKRSAEVGLSRGGVCRFTIEPSSEGGSDREGLRRRATDSSRLGEGLGVDGELHEPQWVVGKGGKIRPDFGTGLRTTNSYYTFYQWCIKTLGVPPHALRKAALSVAADNGATAADLCAIAGWSSIATAYRYLLPKDSNRLAELLRVKADVPKSSG